MIPKKEERVRYGRGVKIGKGSGSGGGGTQSPSGSRSRKLSEQELKSYRESALNEAETRIGNEAKRTLEENAAKDAKAADALLKDTSGEVSRIVRRVTDGDRRHA